jgi:hypothetical protein
MKILTRIRAAHDHDDEVAIREHPLISDGRLEQMPVLVDPAFKIESSQRIHGYLPQRDSRMVRAQSSLRH